MTRHAQETCIITYPQQQEKTMPLFKPILANPSCPSATKYHLTLNKLNQFGHAAVSAPSATTS